MKAIAQWISKFFAFLAFASASSYAQTVDVKALAETMKQGGYVIGAGKAVAIARVQAIEWVRAAK